MKRVREILVTVGVGLVSWVLGFCAFYPAGYIVGQIIYPTLHDWAPNAFPNYNSVIQHEAYELLNANINLWSAILAIFVMSYLTVRFDNRRFELMITKTEGIFTVREGAAIYFPRFALGDGIAALVMVLPFPIVSLFLPEEMPKLVTRIIEPLTALSRVFTDRLGLVLGILVTALCIFLARLLSAFIAMRKWRAAWLSDITLVS